MKTKKTNDGKAKAPGPLEVTMAEVEAQEPCAGEYYFLLRDLKALPTDERRLQYESERNEMIKRPKYGPHDPVPLLKILQTKSHDNSEMSGAERVEWIVSRVGRLCELVERQDAIAARMHDEVREREDAIATRMHDEVHERSWREALKGDSKKDSKKRAAAK